MRFYISWRWYDLWIGAYYDEDARIWFICPIPTVVIAIERKLKL